MVKKLIVFMTKCLLIAQLNFLNIDALRDLIPLVQFKKGEKHFWRSVTFSKVAGFSLQLY